MKKGSVLSGVLAIGAVIGVMATTYFCAKETPEAMEALDEAKQEVENEEEMSIVDKAKVLAPHYIKTGISAGTTVILIASGHIAHLVIAGSLITAGAAWKNKYLDLDNFLAKEAPDVRAKVHKVLAKENIEKKFKELDKKPIEKLKKKARELNNAGSGEETVAVYEEYSEQIIYTTKDRFFMTKLMANEKIASGQFLSVDDIVRGLGGKHSNELTEIGWSTWNSVQDEDFINSDKGFFLDMQIDIYGKGAIVDQDMLYIFYNIPPRRFDPREFHL